jgi:hypothetical protein
MATTQLVTVVFYQVEEFLAELEKDATRVDRRIVRITKLSEEAKISTGINHVSVFATYTVEDQLITLKCYCGDTSGLSKERDGETIGKANKYIKTIEEACKHLKLEARAGAILGDRKRCGR